MKFFPLGFKGISYTTVEESKDQLRAFCPNIYMFCYENQVLKKAAFVCLVLMRFDVIVATSALIASG